jgi:hypothetical protein
LPDDDERDDGKNIEPSMEGFAWAIHFRSKETPRPSSQYHLGMARVLAQVKKKQKEQGATIPRNSLFLFGSGDWI